MLQERELSLRDTYTHSKAAVVEVVRIIMSISLSSLSLQLQQQQQQTLKHSENHKAHEQYWYQYSHAA